jgi:hypothetical protein
LELVDRGIIRILDITFVTKDPDGSVVALEVGDLKQAAAAFAAFEGASSGLLGMEDLQEAAAALDPGTSAAVLVWENRWAAPVAAALRRSGGQLVASGRLPVQAVLAALDAVEAGNLEGSRSCLDCFVGSPGRRWSPGRRRRSAIVSRVGRPSVGSVRGLIPMASPSRPIRSRRPSTRRRPRPRLSRAIWCSSFGTWPS